MKKRFFATILAIFSMIGVFSVIFSLLYTFSKMDVLVIISIGAFSAWVFGTLALLKIEENTDEQSDYYGDD